MSVWKWFFTILDLFPGVPKAEREQRCRRVRYRVLTEKECKEMRKKTLTYRLEP